MINMRNEQAQALESTVTGKDLPLKGNGGPFVAGSLAFDWPRPEAQVTRPSARTCDY
jgi:hypothetical protein